MTTKYGDEAEFFRVKAWNSQAEAAAYNLVKGRRTRVEGALRQDSYEKDGESVRARRWLGECASADCCGGLGFLPGKGPLPRALWPRSRFR